MKPTLKTQLLDRYRITSGKDFRLADHDPNDVAAEILDKTESQALLTAGVARLSALQELLYPYDLVVGAVHLPGDGCGRQGRHDQARHVRA